MFVFLSTAGTTRDPGYTGSHHTLVSRKVSEQNIAVLFTTSLIVTSHVACLCIDFVCVLASPSILHHTAPPGLKWQNPAIHYTITLQILQRIT